MNFIPMHKLGPHAAGTQVHFGALFPGVSAQRGYAVEVRLIHQDDQFIQSEPAHPQAMQHSVDTTYGDYWETVVDLALPSTGAHWGRPGEYIYRFAVRKPDGQEIDEVDLLRSNEYSLLALLFGRAPTAEVLARLSELKGDGSPLGLAHIALADAALAMDPDAISREFFDMFIGVGRGELLPYASYYLTGFLYERPLARVREAGHLASNDRIAVDVDPVSLL